MAKWLEKADIWPEQLANWQKIWIEWEKSCILELCNRNLLDINKYIEVDKEVRSSAHDDDEDAEVGYDVGFSNMSGSGYVGGSSTMVDVDPREEATKQEFVDPGEEEINQELEIVQLDKAILEIAKKTSLEVDELSCKFMYSLLILPFILCCH